jgi:hypothetical protein
MARGWESKSVESQIESAAEKGSAQDQRPSPADRERQRAIESLRLSRARVAQQLSVATDQRYVDSLRRALADIDAQLQGLERK